MDKGIGFRRNIRLAWLDATAALCAETVDAQRIRERLNTIVDIESTENRRMAIDILLNIWTKTEERYPNLRQEAVGYYRNSGTADDRLWFHYGLTLLAYPFFRLATSTIGQLTRYADTVTPKDIKKRMIAELGQLGALDKAVERVAFSLRDWGLLIDTGKRYVYAPRTQRVMASSPLIEVWFLEAVLAAHPAEEMPFADLVRLPELFPFQFTIGVDDLRRSTRFEVQRQGIGWDMVRLVQEQPRTRVVAQLAF